MHREGEVRMGAGPKGLPDPWPDLGPHPSPASAHPTGSQGHRPRPGALPFILTMRKP